MRASPDIKRPPPCPCGAASWRHKHATNTSGFRLFYCAGCGDKQSVYQRDGEPPAPRPLPDCYSCHAKESMKRVGGVDPRHYRLCRVCGMRGTYTHEGVYVPSDRDAAERIASAERWRNRPRQLAKPKVAPPKPKQAQRFRINPDAPPKKPVEGLVDRLTVKSRHRIEDLMLERKLFKGDVYD